MSQSVVHNMLRCQTKVYVPTFVYNLLFQAYWKHNARLKFENHKHTEVDPKNAMLKKRV